MGCDIHCYIEYRRKPVAAGDEEQEWDSFGGRINPGRNYELFGRLAGVRQSLPSGGVKPRGLPSQVGYAAYSDFWLYIVDGEREAEPTADPVTQLMRACLANPEEPTPRRMLFDELQTRMEAESEGRGYLGTTREGVARKDAERYAAYGKAYKMDHTGTPRWVEHPDWHSHAWLTPDEWEKAIGKPNRYSPEYQAILGTMRAFEAVGCEARVVFWFDN